MNIDLKSLRSTLRRLSSGRIPTSREIIHPVRDWMFVLGVATSTFLITALYFGYDFYMLLHSDEIPREESTPSVTYKRAEAESILTSYRDRRAQFEKLLGEESAGAMSTYLEVEATTTPRAPLAGDEEEQYSDATTTDAVVE